MTVIFQPSGKRTDAAPGDNLLDLAQRAGVDLSAVCGGVGVCGSCRVTVISGDVSAPTLLEDDLLTPAEQQNSVRLACQTAVQASDVLIDVPESSMRVAQRVMLEGQTRPASGETAGLVAVYDVTAAPPSADDLRGDWERLDGVPEDCPAPEPSVLAALPAILRTHDWQARLVTHSGRPVAVMPPGAHPLGLAVDVGTTSLAAYLIDFTSGATLAAKGITNPQVSYGEDVMARLTTVMNTPHKTVMMQSIVVAALNDLTRALCKGAGVEPSAVVDVVAAGNTAMHHLLYGLPVAQLGAAPYVPVVGAALTARAADIGLTAAPGAGVYAPPVVAGFVGADHIAMLLAAEMDAPGPVSLALDIGTNTEISLRVNDHVLTCSAASGPAFEGAHIRDGMRAGAGAIERAVWDDGRVRWLTIEDAPPVGICGSGLLDLLGVLRKQDVLNNLGVFREDAPGYFRNGRRSGLEIVPAEETGHGHAIRLERADVSEIQMAKGAIRAGIKLLCEHADIAETDIERVIVAGAFGSYITVCHAVEIGMLPPLPESAVEQIGNAAGAGARLMLVDANARRRAETLARRIQYIELTTHPDFADRFSQAVLLTPNPWD